MLQGLQLPTSPLHPTRVQEHVAIIDTKITGAEIETPWPRFYESLQRTRFFARTGCDVIARAPVQKVLLPSSHHHIQLPTAPIYIHEGQLHRQQFRLLWYWLAGLWIQHLHCTYFSATPTKQGGT